MALSWHRPNSLEELWSLVNTTDERVYYQAGGTDLHLQIQRHIITDGLVFCLAGLPGLNVIQMVSDGLYIGAGVSINALRQHPLVAKHLPLLVYGLQWFASPAIRNMATLGGNLGTGSPAADGALLLTALNARVITAGPDGKRNLAMDDFYTGYKKNSLKRGEIITGFIVPTQPENSSFYYRRAAMRPHLSIIKTAVAGWRAADGQVYLAAGSVSPFPKRLHLLEAEPASQPDRLRELLGQEIEPISDQRSTAAYRFATTFNLVQECLGRILPPTPRED